MACTRVNYVRWRKTPESVIGMLDRIWLEIHKVPSHDTIDPTRIFSEFNFVFVKTWFVF